MQQQLNVMQYSVKKMVSLIKASFSNQHHEKNRRYMVNQGQFFKSDWAIQTLPTGEQLWAEVRHDVIRNAGSNTIHKTFSPLNGFCGAAIPEGKSQLVQIFFMARCFFDKRFWSNKSFEPLRKSFLLNRCKKNWATEPEAEDPRVWPSWLDAVHSVLISENITPSSTVTPFHRFRIAQQYLQSYGLAIESDEIMRAAKEMDIRDEQSFNSSNVGKDWNMVEEAFIRNSYRFDGYLLVPGMHIVSTCKEGFESVLQFNMAQIFIITKAFLAKQHFDSYNSEYLEDIITGLILHKCRKDWQSDPETWDPAVWGDWLVAVNSVLEPVRVSAKDTIFSARQGYEIMQRYVYDYACRLNSDDLKKLSEILDIKSNASFQDSKAWKDWYLCVDALMNYQITIEGYLLSFKTSVTQQQAFEIMQRFLSDYQLKAKYIQNKEWFSLVQGLRFESSVADPVFKDWLASISSAQVDSYPLEVIQVFDAIRIFVEQQYKDTKSEDLKILLETLQLDKNQMPAQYYTIYALMHAAYAVMFK